MATKKRNIPKPPVSCIILAGGKSSRIGQEKAFLRIGERTIIEEQRDTLKKVFEEIIIVTNDRKKFKNISTKVVTDIIPDSGPMGGLYSGLSVCSNIHSFLVGCDMPFINVELIGYMIRHIGENDIVIPRSSRGVETLFAVYSINCLDTIRTQLEQGKLRLFDILNFHRVKYISFKEVEKFDPQGFSFFNVNNPTDYEEALKIWLRK
jgi:molybdopterin-guanine dinucleotide biosynthesis protein A